MRAVFWKTCWWPGLAALWLRGHLGGLALAIAFGLAVQFALLRTFAPVALPDWLVLAVSPVVAWSCVVGLWVTGVWLGQTSPSAAVQDPQIDPWLSEAQREYLKGHWIEAEAVLSRLLARRPEDVEARLLLTSIYRRSKRLNEARRTLDELMHCESAARWLWELRLEAKRIEQIEQEHASSETEECQQQLPRAA